MIDSLITVLGWIWDHLAFINLIFSVMIVFFQRKDPKSVWTWLLVLYFIPVLGFVFYLLIGNDMHKSRMFRVKEAEDGLNRTIQKQEEMLLRRKTRINSLDYEEYRALALYNLEVSGAVYTNSNHVKIFTDGVDKFNDLIKELKQAERYIHLQYYIIRDDELFQEVAGVLKERAAAGVEVRLLYDAMGCKGLSRRFIKELKEAGILAVPFFPAAFGWLQMRINYRNHRKIAVIDGRAGYVGGFNIGREYISKSPKFGYWRDTHLKIRGNAVIGLQIRFALDWNYAAKENLFLSPDYFTVPDERPGDNGIQIISSGPDAKTKAIRDNYLQIINKAKRNVYIQTPYFIPDEAVLSALLIAARSGVDVRVMIPCKPDHPFVYWATMSYIGDLLEAGARCYTYDNGFLHAKTMTADGKICCVGTANMDIRSYELNFEVNATIYNWKTAEKLDHIFEEDLKHCTEITRESYAKRSLLIRLKEQISRPLSPLL